MEWLPTYNVKGDYSDLTTHRWKETLHPLRTLIWRLRIRILSAMVTPTTVAHLPPVVVVLFWCSSSSESEWGDILFFLLKLFLLSEDLVEPRADLDRVGDGVGDRLSALNSSSDHLEFEPGELWGESEVLWKLYSHIIHIEIFKTDISGGR